ncbi:MAG: hypothetical protein ABFQ62_03860 [Patescibacteria group bacterium]
MKESSLKTLLVLYTTTEKPLWLDYFQLQFVLQELSYAGLRSLISQMKKRNLLHTELLMKKTRICITDIGKRKLEAEFPAFSPRLGSWKGELSCVVFLTAPKTDKQFRYLRNVLVSIGCLQISRGIYAYPGKLPEMLINECKNSYQKSVIAFTINKYIFGDLQGLIMGQFSISELVQSYSGIGKEIDRLLNLNKPLASFNDQQKKHFYSVFDRFFKNLQSDMGLINYYFPQVSSAQQLLAHLQQIITQI